MKKLMIILMITGVFAGCKNSKKLSQNNTSPQRNMYLDVHHLGKGNVTAQAVAKAHAKDLATQEKYGVNFIKYWVDEEQGDVYCLSESPNEEMVKKTHEEAHGLVPQEVRLVSAGEAASLSGDSRLFLDIHNLGKGNVTAEAVAEAHEHDLKVQGKYGVNFINYWVDEDAGMVYCLSEAKNSDAVVQTHTEAHGLVPDEIVEVIQGE